MEANEEPIQFEKQTKLHDPVNGIKGNCMMACYANYLGLSISQVPAIEELFDCKKPEGFWWDALQLWWKLMGYEYHYTELQEDMPASVKQGIYFASGLSPRGVYHLVMYQNGKMIFDPHPSNDGIIGEPRYYEWVIPFNSPHPNTP